MPQEQDKLVELTPDNWGEVVLRLQRLKGFSSKMITDKVGISQPTLMKMKEGENRSITTLFGIFKTFGVKIYVKLPLTDMFDDLLK